MSANTTGPAELRRLVTLLSEHTGIFAISVDLGMLAAAWDADIATIEKMANSTELIARAERAEAANMVERGEWSKLYAQLTGDEGAYSLADLTSAIKAQTDALKRARALLAEVYDDSPCRLDHHGYCQEHIGGINETCWMRRVAAALAPDGAR